MYSVSGRHVFFDATRATCHVAYVAREIGAFGRVGGEAAKRQVAYVAWEIAAVKPKSQVAYVAWGNLGLWGGVGGKSEESGGLCSMGNRGPLGGSAVKPKNVR